MKLFVRLLTILNGVFFASFSHAQSNVYPAQSKVVNASLFYDGAIITRKIEKLPSFDKEITLEIKDVEELIYENDIQVVLSGKVNLLKTNIVRDSQHFKTNPEYIQYSKKLKQLEDSLQNLEVEINVNKRLLQVLEENKKIRVSDKSIYTDDLNELLVFYKNQYRIYFKNADSLNKHQRIVSERIHYLRRKVDGIVGDAKSAKLILQLTLAKEESTTKYELAFWYKTKSIFWKPTATLQVREKDDECYLNIKSEINYKNLTWKDVNISYIDGKLKDDFGQKVNRESKVLSLESQAKIAYQTVVNRLVKSKLIYTCWPIENLSVNAHLNLWDLSGISLPEMTMEILFQNIYMGKISLHKEILTDSVNLFLGKVPWIEVNRVLVNDKTKKSILNGLIKSTYEYKIDVKNHSDIQVELIINEKLPFSLDEKVQVEYNLPSYIILLERNKMFTQRLRLEPNSYDTIEYDYKIIYPQNIRLEEVLDI